MKRTKKTPLSVIITEREEPFLERTIKSVFDSFPANQQLPQIVIIQDGGDELRKLTHGLLDGRRDKHILPWSGRLGCQRARDAGIMAADRDIVVMIDAHMDFEFGVFNDMMKLVE